MEELATAFDRVMNPRDWKAPIEATIQASDRILVEKAVLYFTHTVPHFEAIPGEPDRLVVRARGYELGRTGQYKGAAMARPSDEMGTA